MQNRQRNIFTKFLLACCLAFMPVCCAYSFDFSKNIASHFFWTKSYKEKHKPPTNNMPKTMEEYQEEYQECYACLTIKVMLDTFMQVASQTYGVSQLGGVVLLKIGAFLWVAFWVIKKISSFTQKTLITTSKKQKMMQESPDTNFSQG